MEPLEGRVPPQDVGSLESVLTVLLGATAIDAEVVAAKPAAWTELSDVKMIRIEPDLAVIAGGIALPENTPIGALPSKTLTKS
jgi:hypothetical protein